MDEASIYYRELNVGGQTSKKTIKDVCENLKMLHDGQGRLEKQMEDITCTLRMLIDVQKRMASQNAASVEQCLDQQSTAITDAESRTIPNRPYPQFDAGQRLTETFELLEMILLELPSKDVLFAQGVSKRFRSTITGSCSLQLRLFFITDPLTSATKNVILNPILTHQKILPHLPLYFDHKGPKLAYCHRNDRIRVFCTAATVVKDDISGQEWIHLKLTNLWSPYSFGWFEEERQRPFGAGSWKQMCFSQPPCDIKWHLAIVEDNREHRYSGIIEGKPTVDTLLDAFAAAVVIDEGEHRHRSNRR